MRGLLCLIILLSCLHAFARQDSLSLFDLKVKAARNAGLDATELFRTRTQAYRQELFIHYLLEQLGNEEQLRSEYEKQRVALRQIAQIYKYLPQNLPAVVQERVELQMDSIYLCLQHGTLDFAAAVSRFSDKQDTCWFETLQMPREWVMVLDTLETGKFSSPFYAPQGIFILKQLGEKFSPSFEAWKRLFLSCELQKQRTDLLTNLKEICNYSANKKAEHELFRKGKTEDVLFEIGQEKYTGSSFALFTSSYMAGLKRQLEKYVRWALLDYVYRNLEILSSEADVAIREYGDSLLVELITMREVIEPSRKDTLGIRNFFETHRKNYCWSDARYKGVVLCSSDKRLLKHARKQLKRLSEDVWMDYILQINSCSSTQIKAEKAIFVKGDNPYVDEKIFKVKQITTIDSDYPYSVLVGRKIKEPENWLEVKEQVISDFQKYLEQCWITRLKASVKVEIDQEDLKTVN